MVKDNIKCNLCGSNRYIIKYRSDAKDEKTEQLYRITSGELLVPERIFKCVECGLVFARPTHDTSKLSTIYAEYVDEWYIKTEEGRRHTARSILKKLDKYKRHGNRLLEVGCSAGFFLAEAQKMGWEVRGIEPSGWAAGYAKEKFNLEIINKSLEECGLPDGYFDSVVIFDTIEHMTNPKEVLARLQKVLKPNGILYLTTPDIECLSSKLLKIKWWGISQFHLFYFSKSSLNKMLNSAGFECIKFVYPARTFSYSYWLERIKGYNQALYVSLNFIIRLFHFQDKLITINLKDQIGVFARKRRTLEWVDEFDRFSKTTVERVLMKTVVVLPAYNAAKTLEKTINDIPKDVVDDIILVDDCSKDNTVEVARGLGLKTFVHENNQGYGANQKTCYDKALDLGADIVVMVHPDYQYDPRIINELIAPIREGQADAVFGSRMMKGGALEGGMPLWKHNANILLTAIENVILGTYLTEYHSGFRAYSAKVLKRIPYKLNSNNFIFDTEIIVQMLTHYFKIEEVPIRTRYFDEASSIKLWPSIIYGLEILATLFKYFLHTRYIIRFKQFE
ncbi:MAG: methyltransferase domain-containing protein [Candidatus Omnitrophica bacterium]|nr:methyltransferase domain-containing protein [Candidatus Omnitrophota bacterium]